MINRFMKALLGNKKEDSVIKNNPITPAARNMFVCEPASKAIGFKLLSGCEDLKPIKAHKNDAAYDLKSRIDDFLKPGDTALIPTGLFLQLPPGFEAQVRPRSGLALKHSITVLNSPGTVDAGYRGEVGVILFNAGKEDFKINRGDRIAQMVIQKLPDVILVEVKDLNGSSRGADGFGSSGV